MKKGREALLLWCQRQCQNYPNIKVENFHKSWRDGRAFCAIIHNNRSELLPNPSTLNANEPLKNLNLAFDTGEKIGIPKLLDAEDMLVGDTPEQFSVMTYLSQMYHAFSNSKGAGIASIQQPPVEAAPPPNRPSSPSVSQKLNTPTAGRSPATSTASMPSGGKPTQPPAAPSTGANSGDPTPMCKKCGKLAAGNMVTFADTLYHETCFKCNGCGRAFRNTCLNIEGQPYCDACGRKAFVQSRLLKRGTATPGGGTSAVPSTEDSSSNRPASMAGRSPATSVASSTSTSSLAETQRLQREREETERKQKEEAEAKARLERAKALEAAEAERKRKELEEKVRLEKAKAAEEELRRKKEAEEKAKAEEFARKKREMEEADEKRRKMAAEEEAKRKKEQEEKSRVEAEKMRLLKEEEEKKKKAEMEARLKREEEERQRKLKEEEERKKKAAENEARLKREEEERKKKDADLLRQRATSVAPKQSSAPTLVAPAPTRPVTTTIVGSTPGHSSSLGSGASKIEQEREELERMDREIQARRRAETAATARSSDNSPGIPEWQLRARQLGDLRSIRQSPTPEIQPRAASPSVSVSPARVASPSITVTSAGHSDSVATHSSAPTISTQRPSSPEPLGLHRPSSPSPVTSNHGSFPRPSVSNRPSSPTPTTVTAAAHRPSAAPPSILTQQAKAAERVSTVVSPPKQRSSVSTVPPEPSRADIRQRGTTVSVPNEHAPASSGSSSPVRSRPSIAETPPQPSLANIRQRGETQSTPQRPSTTPKPSLLDQIKAEENAMILASADADLDDETIDRHLTRTITQLRFVDMKKINDGLSGYLKKRNNTIGIVWQRRWFSLQGYRLLYYKDEQAKFTLAAESPPEAYISLQYVTDIRVAPENEHNGKFTIQAHELEWELEANDDTERALWLNYLDNAISYYKAAFQQHKLTLDHSPISQADLLTRKEGILRKQGRFNKWSDRHFVLQDGILFYFKKKNSKRSGRLPLYGCAHGHDEVWLKSRSNQRRNCIFVFRALQCDA